MECSQGSKKAVDRIKISCCTNAISDYLVKLLVIYKLQNPFAFENTNKMLLLIFCCLNKIAWVTTYDFQYWFNSCFVSSIWDMKKRTCK